ncbi:Zn-dependent hydrolase [Phyllobacterium phragmitis]|uniref:Zn-dependent hydrolase n=1 Tax=Phyllobacterium phragmitis TaxID=2670329 RepID=A0A2S9IQZ1_9HYPH|nr:Zn-dependent hydrolase [Phyllobacterium phragmitis]PRD42944.1 Zn-dependent hydrolase [Phyllobacterium phragmitis]
MPCDHLAINPDRLRGLLEGINSFGFNRQTGGYNRVGYSDADMAVREWFMDQMRAAGLVIHRDGVANLFGRFGPAEGPCVMVGSHLDTVPEGGAFDGALGVAVALECVCAIQDAGLLPKCAIEIVATAEEEGRFGGMLGSQSIAGVVDSKWLSQASDADGVMLVDAMAVQGLNANDALAAKRSSGDIRAFLELHVEQGPVLESRSMPIGIAYSVAGVRNLGVRFEGEANHSGTTPMNLRADAFAGLAAIGTAIPGIIARYGHENTRVTIGKADLRPNFIHTIPGEAEFVINIRDTEAEGIDSIDAALRNAIASVARANNLKASIVEQSRIAPVQLDRDLATLFHEEAHRLGLEALAMPSGAGHDAQTMQASCPSALIFVPSRGGISHSPMEWTDWADIERGANLMLAALVRLSGSTG